MALTQHTAYAFSTDRASIMHKHPENTTTWNKSSAPSTTSNPPTAHKVRQWPEGTKAPSAAWKGTLPNRVYFHLFLFFPHLHSVLFFTLKTVKMFRTTPKPLIKTEGKKGVPNLTKPSPALLSALLLSTAVKLICCLIHMTSYPRKLPWGLCLIYPLSAAESFQCWMTSPWIYCLSKAAAVGNRRSRKNSNIQEVTFLTSSDPYLCCGGTVWKDSRPGTRQNCKAQKEWGKAVTTAGCWAPLREQLETQLHTAPTKKQSAMSKIRRLTRRGFSDSK